MKKHFTINPRIFLVLALALLMMLNIGCAGKMYEEGFIVSPYYKSAITANETAGNKIPVSIMIKPLYFTPASNETHGGGFALRMLPLICLIPVSPDQTMTNIFPAKKLMRRTPGEIENVITNELNRTELFNEVVFEGDQKNFGFDIDQKDYDIKGTVNFKIDMYTHFAGFGGVSCIVPPVLAAIFLTLPVINENFICEAHFDIVENKTNKIIFSKDYYSKELLVMALFYGKNRYSIKELFGEKVFPPILKEFVNDLKVSLEQNLAVSRLSKN